MEQLSLARDDFGRGGHSPKLFVFPLVNGSSISMYPWKYTDETEDNQTSMQTLEKGYEQFVADVWVGIVLTLMVLSCLCCICSCLLYHRLLEWKRKVFGPPGASVADASARRESGGSHSSGRSEVESLPSYTVVSGLPSYEEALEQLKMAHGEKAQLVAQEVEEGLREPPPPPLLELDVGGLLPPPPPFPAADKGAGGDVGR